LFSGAAVKSPVRGGKLGKEAPYRRVGRPDDEKAYTALAIIFEMANSATIYV
jgi:hypothetical protein